MAEEETVYTSKVTYNGFFKFGDFYNFCYSWLKDETGMDLAEVKYSEKLVGDAKNLEIEWKGERKLTDYFKFRIKVKMRINGLTNVELNQDGNKVSTNKGSCEMKVEGILIRDYNGKFETSAFRKFLRSIYEKWVIPARIEEYIAKVIQDCDEFLNQAKAYFDLEGKK